LGDTGEVLKFKFKFPPLKGIVGMRHDKKAQFMCSVYVGWVPLNAISFMAKLKVKRFMANGSIL